jgi:hypothetical protein
VHVVLTDAAGSLDQPDARWQFAKAVEQILRVS